KVWIYKGDILPYKVSTEDKISREAAMAVGETSGQGRPRRVISAGGGRRRPEQGGPGEQGEGTAATAAEPVTPPSDDAGGEAKPLVPEVDADLERLLAEEEDIERRTRGAHHEAPHMRPESD